MNPAISNHDASLAPRNRVRTPEDIPARRARIPQRSYAEEEANHDRWVELLSPWTLTCAARELAPWPRPRRRWKLFRERERPPTAYEIWRVERHAALVRRLEQLGYPCPSSRR